MFKVRQGTCLTGEHLKVETLMNYAVKSWKEQTLSYLASATVTKKIKFYYVDVSSAIIDDISEKSEIQAILDNLKIDIRITSSFSPVVQERDQVFQNKIEANQVQVQDSTISGSSSTLSHIAATY